MTKLDQLRALREQSSQAKRKPSSRAANLKPSPAAKKKLGTKKKAGKVPGLPVVRRGRPRMEDRDKTLTATEPWKALGFSRRTYFRRVAEKKRVDNSVPK